MINAALQLVRQKNCKNIVNKTNLYVHQIHFSSFHTLYTPAFLPNNSSHLGMSQPATPHISIYGLWCQRAAPIQRPIRATLHPTFPYLVTRLRTLTAALLACHT
jgi:hypothetical protein